MDRSLSMRLLLRACVVAALAAAPATSAVVHPPTTSSKGGNGPSISVRAAVSVARAFVFSVSEVTHGDGFDVHVTDAPCEDVIVTFLLDGVIQDSRSCSVGESAQFFAPTGSKGSTWTIIVQCPGGTSSSQTGVIG